MPPQGATSHSDQDQSQQRVRVRNNQRNSRARRQAYVKELERKWAECVQVGARANVEMQQAARRVAAENALLKHMLNEQGLNDEAIDSRVEQFWHDHSSASTPDDRASSSSIPPSFGSSGILVPQLSCSTSTCARSTTQTQDQGIPIQNQTTASPQMTTPSAGNNVLGLPTTASLEDKCSSSWESDGWLDDLYDANGIFNEDLGDALDSFMAGLNHS